MDNRLFYLKLIETFPQGIISGLESFNCETIQVEKDNIKEIIVHLKENLGFIFLTDLCGVHYPDSELPFSVVYHLHNLQENKRLRLKTYLDKQPVVDSVSAIFSSANWMERETFDFYGIHFQGHPNLIRILNVEYLDYFPMRKEYPLEDPTREDKDDRFFGR
jgi:NADH-quinone oxidoreductase subunit C